MSQQSFVNDGPTPLKDWQRSSNRITPFSEHTTSKEAAVRAMSFAPNLREQVFQVIVDRGEVTADEIETVLNRTAQSITPRLWELCGNGKHPVRIAKTENRRKTRSGGSARTYAAII